MNSKEKSDQDAAQVARFLTTDPIEIEKKVNKPIRNLLHKYSHIREDHIVTHVLELVRTVRSYFLNSTQTESTIRTSNSSDSRSRFCFR